MPPDATGRAAGWWDVQAVSTSAIRGEGWEIQTRQALMSLAPISSRQGKVIVSWVSPSSRQVAGPRPLLTDRFQRAFALASEVHARQVRKGTRIPYLAHLMSVAALVLEHDGRTCPTSSTTIPARRAGIGAQ